MSSARADRNTPQIPKGTFKDIILDFSKNPITGYIGMVLDDRAVSQFLRSLVLTATGEWPFEPDNGSAIRRVLFDPGDSISLDMLRKTIMNVIRNRASSVITLVNVQITPYPLRDAVGVIIFYQMRGKNEIVSVNVLLKRVR